MANCCKEAYGTRVLNLDNIRSAKNGWRAGFWALIQSTIKNARAASLNRLAPASEK